MKQLSILISSFMRPQLLKWNLQTLARQKIPFDFETILLNDGLPDESEQLASLYQDALKLRYVFTGQRNSSGNIVYRVPGFAFNIGAKLAEGQVIIICCGEMYHVNDTVRYLTEPVLYDSNLVSTCIGMDDDGTFLASLERNDGWYDWREFRNSYPLLNTRLPFLMAINRQRFYNIGGYDEDMVGFAYDNNDLIDRLLTGGCTLYLTQAQTMHLNHQGCANANVDTDEYRYNSRLYKERQGKLLRNQGREWGLLHPQEESRLRSRPGDIAGLSKKD